MQKCSRCGMTLIIGLTAEIVPDGTDSPDIECLQCLQLNTPRESVYETKPTYDEDWENEHIRDMDDPQDWLGYAPGKPPDTIR